MTDEGREEQILGDDAPRKDWDLRRAQRRARLVQRVRADKGRQVQPPGEGDIRLYHCPCQELEEVAGIAPNSVNLVLTDIPYDGGFIPQVAEFGAFSSRVLVPGGLLVTYSG